MSLHPPHIWFSIEGHQLPFLQHAHTIFGWTCSILTNLVFWEMQERKSEDHHWLCSTFAFIMFNHQRKSWGNLESVKIYFWVVKHTLSSVVKMNILIDIIWIFVFASWSSCGQRVEVWPRGLDDNLATGTTPTLRRLLASSSSSSPWTHYHRRHQRGGRQLPWWEGHWRLLSVSASIGIVAPFVIASVF